MVKRKRKTIVVALYAGPGTGKSTLMAAVFAELKFRGVNAEMAPEFAKEKVWEGSTRLLRNQIYVFGKQYNTIYRVDGQVDVVVTDSPVLLSLIYGKHESRAFRDLILDVNSRTRNMNFFLIRRKKYNPIGRMQNEAEAKVIDGRIKRMLRANKIPFEEIEASRVSVQIIVDKVMEAHREG